MDPKKINTCIYLEYLNASGGMEFYNNGMLKSLEYFHSKIFFLTNNEESLDLESEITRAKRIIPNIKKSGKIKFLFILFKVLFLLSRKNHKDKKRVILHVFEFNILEAVILLYSRILYFQTISIIHDANPLNGSNPILKKFYLKITNIIWVHSAYTKSELTNHVQDIPIYNIYASDLDYTFNNPPGIKKFENDTPVEILFFGQLKATKGINELVNTFKRISKRVANINLNICGRPWKLDISELSDQISEIENINLNLNFLSITELHEVINSADIIVLPYKEVYNSGVIKRTLGYGKIAIVSNLEPFTDIVKDKINGFVFTHEIEGDFDYKLMEAIQFARNGGSFKKENSRFQSLEEQVLLTRNTMEECLD